MADIAPRLIELSAGKLHSLHQRLHKSELTPEVLEVHHLVINEALRRGLMRVEEDAWDKYEIQIDYLENVDISNFSESLPEDAVADLVRKMGSSIGNIRTVLTVNGYELRIDSVAKHLQGQHDQQAHAGDYARRISDELESGGHPTVAPEDVSALFGGMAKLTSHPDITELKIKGTLLFGDEGMGVARSDMPQIPSSERENFLADIEKDNGITHEKEKVDPTTLKPIQKEVSGSRAGAIYEKFAEKGAIPKGERILISKDGFVVDGHHTWAAAVAFSFDNPGTELPVYRLSVNAKEALEVSVDYAKANGYESKAMSDNAKYGDDGKEIKKSDLFKHGTHDQKTHGSWANGSIPDMKPDVAPEAGRDPQAVAVATALRNQFIKIEPEITKTMFALADKVGGTMDGLEDRIKSTDSLARKIQDDSKKDGVTFEQAAGQVSDAVRYTMVFSEKDYADAAKRIDAQLRTDGFEPRTKNFWREGDPYQGINIKATKNGVTAELQLHTPKSLEIKKEIHPIYKLESKTADAQAKYKLYMREVRYARRIPFPEDRQLLSTIGVQSFQFFETPRQAGLIKTTGVDIMETIRGE